MVIDDKQLRKILKARCKETGSQRAWAKKHKLDETHLSRVLSGERDFSEEILKALKAKRVGQYMVSEMEFEDM